MTTITVISDSENIQTTGDIGEVGPLHSLMCYKLNLHIYANWFAIKGNIFFSYRSLHITPKHQWILGRFTGVLV